MSPDGQPEMQQAPAGERGPVGYPAGSTPEPAGRAVTNAPGYTGEHVGSESYEGEGMTRKDAFTSFGISLLLMIIVITLAFPGAGPLA